MFQVAEWFGKLYPDVSFPASRIPLLITRKQKKFSEVKDTPGEAAFLLEELDLDKVSDGLSKLGLKRKELLAATKTVELPGDFVCDNPWGLCL